MATIVGSSNTGTIPTHTRATQDFGNPFPKSTNEDPSALQHEHQSTHNSLLRLFSETAHHLARSHPHLHTFFPRFDLEEHATAYELFGELPGCKQKDVFIHAVDDSSIEISGHTYRYSYPADPASGKAVEVAHVPVTSGKGAVSAKRSEWPDLAEPGMQAAVLEQEGGAAMSERRDESTSNGFAKAEANGAAPAEAVKGGEGTGDVREGSENKERTLFHERLVGKFVRTIRFPGPVRADKVVAELKDGILRVRVEKDLEKEESLEKEKKRIEIAWSGASLWGI